jgi:hypothetical protein
MTNINIASNEPQKPVNPSTPANPQQQQSQNDPKPASDKPGNQQK